MWGTKRRYFKTFEEAIAFARDNLDEDIFSPEEDIYYYAEDSDTKYEYIGIMEVAEGYFDEDYAKQFPYCLDYVVELNS